MSLLFANKFCSYSWVNYNNTKITIDMDMDRDKKLTDFSKKTLLDRYVLPKEKFQELFARVAISFADHRDHAQRIYDYISNLWFMPATPILTNGGVIKRGLPISCYLNEIQDSLESIIGTWSENSFLSSCGGGVGTYMGNLRSVGEPVGINGRTSGIIPFICVIDSLTRAISQGGNLRRGAAAVYLDVSHPEIMEFLELRRPTGGDPARKALNIHHAILVCNNFMQAVEADTTWNLISPLTKKVIKTLKAREIWIKILNIRVETGEPYIIFIDRVNQFIPEHHKLSHLKVKMSNLCSEITLPTGVDHLGKNRTAVCCLSSLNLEYYTEWKDNNYIIEDCLRFLDNVLTYYIAQAPQSMKSAVYSASRERSVGLGVMGFHTLLQSQRVPLESVTAKVWNNNIFSHIRQRADEACYKLAQEKGPCPDAQEHGILKRFSCKLAIAPTASISIIAGSCSPGIEPLSANCFVHKTLSGFDIVKNKYLNKLLTQYNKNTPEIWNSIIVNSGSVNHLDFLTQDDRDIFKTAYELNQEWLIELAADRQKYICQSQSLNLFFHANVHKETFNRVHFLAWRRGIKSLYYCRSTAITRSESETTSGSNFEDCLACQ